MNYTKIRAFLVFVVIILGYRNTLIKKKTKQTTPYPFSVHRPSIFQIQYFYRIYPISVTVPYRNAPHRTMLYVSVFLKNTIVTLFVTFTVTFTVTFYPVTRTVTSIVTLNCNGEYTVTPTVTVITITAS